MLLQILAAPTALLCIALLALQLWTVVNAKAWESFPESCSVRGCCRWSLERPSCRAPHPPLQLNASEEDVLRELRRWAEDKINWPELLRFERI